MRLGYLAAAVFLITSTNARSATPDCSVQYHFTNRAGDNGKTGQIVVRATPGVTPSFNNISTGCVAWGFSYNSEGFSALSIELDSAPNTLSSLITTPGTFAAFAGTTVSGSNPSTVTTSASFSATGYYPWLQVNLTSATGTGSIDVTLSGWKSPAYLASGSSAAPCPTGLTCNSIGLVTTNLLAYYDLSELTGTTLVDHSGNGNDCTFAAGGNAPTWNTVGLLFNGAQAISCPQAGLATEVTVISWFRNTIPPVIANQFYYQTLFAVDAASTLNFVTGNNGSANFTTSVNQRTIDRFVGNTSLGFKCGATAAFTRSGRAILGIIGQAAINLNCTPATSVIIGSTTTAGLNPWYGTLYAMAIYSNTTTAATDAADDLAVKNFLTRTRGVPFTDELPHNGTNFIDPGTSITEGVGVSSALYSTFEWYSQTSQMPSEFWNLGISGGQYADMKVADVAAIDSVLNSYSNPVLFECCTNNTHGGTTGATTYANVQTYCTAVVALGNPCIATTILPRTDNSGAQNTQAAAYNTALIAGFIAGTATGVSWVRDWAGDPQMGSTQGNVSALYSDGIHPAAAGNAILGSIDAFVKSQVISPRTPACIDKVVAFNTTTVGATAGLTNTVNLLQLFPGQYLYSLTQNTTTAWTGGTIATLTASLGNSLGSTVSYAAPSTVFAATTAPQPVYPAVAIADNGIITATFTSTVGNLSAATAGSTKWTLCIVRRT